MLAVLLACNAIALLLACVGMMVVFLGGEGYLPALLLGLALSLPFGLVCMFVAGGWFVRRAGARKALHELWRFLPGWLVAALALAVALVFCGELALYVTLILSEQAPRLWQHLPLLAALITAIAFAMLEAMRRARNTDR